MKNTTRDSFERMRIEAELRKLTEMETLVRDMQSQLKTVDQQIIDPERMRKLISPVISGALRDAGVEDHGAVASAMAPFVIQTVRSEIINSQDELIEAIHPKLGVLIRAAVTNAVEELNRKVDDALPIDRWIAAIKGKLTGTGAAGFLVGRAKEFQIKEAFFIERASGLLLSRQQIADIDPEETELDEDLLAGMLAALQGFADDAFGSSGAGDLRRFSFTEDTVYLRASPTKILAVRCSGVAPPEIESRIDMLLERAMEQTRKPGGYEGVQLLEDFQTAPTTESDISASKVIGRGLAAVAACFLLVWGHGAIVGANEARWIADIDTAVRAEEGLGPYPVSVTLSEDGSTARVAGLVPDDAARKRLESSLEWVASPLKLDVELGVVRMSGLQ